MSVVFVNRYGYPDHSATSQIMSDLASGLAARGFDVAMVTSRQSYDNPDANLPPLENWMGVEIHRIWTSTFGRGRLFGRAVDYMTFYLSLPAKLFAILKRGDVVVAKTDPPLVSLVVAVVAWLRGATLVNWLQDLFPELIVALGEPRLPRLLTWLLRRLRNVSLHSAALNVVIGRQMAAHLVEEGVAADSIRVIPNWAHEDVIRPIDASDSELRISLGLLDKFVVGYSGNLGRAHDIETLYGAARRLEADSRIVFAIVGGGHGYERLRHRCTESGLGNIVFRPYQPYASMSHTLGMADVHLVSLRPALEGKIVPSKVYGIAAAQRAIGFIGDHDGEVAQLITEHGCGFIVAEGQDEALADEIRRLADDPREAIEQGRKSRQMLEVHFSRANAHTRWQVLFEEFGQC